MKNKILAIMVLFSSLASAQDVKQMSTGNNSPNVAIVSGDLVVKSSPAEDALIESAKQMEEVANAYNALMQQARINLDKKNKPILDEIAVRSKKWQDKIDADTKDLRAKINANNTEAQSQFQKETAALFPKQVSPDTIKALEGVVKKEQGLPDHAHFDINQKKWVLTPEVKK